MRSVFPLTLVLLLSLLFRLLLFPPDSKQYAVGERIELTGVIWEDPRRNQFSQRFTVEELTISVPEYPEYSFGDTITVNGTVEENKFFASNGEEIVELVLKNPEISVQEPALYMRGVIWMLNRISQVVTDVLPSDEAALLLGITIGVKSEFSKELLDTFTATGILHVVAASGSNVATLTGVVLYSLNYLFHRKVAILGTSIIIGWYALLAGFDPPIVRASIMAMIALIAQMIGRQNHSLLALGITIWAMLMVDPQLITSIGFQLSVSATGGIILIKPILDFLIRMPKVIRDDISTTLAAQIGSMPILVGAFGSFAPISILLNVSVLWLVPVIMILGLLGSIASLLNSIIAIPFLYGAYPFLVYFLMVVTWSSQFISPVSVPGSNEFLTLSYYLITISIIMILRRKMYA